MSQTISCPICNSPSQYEFSSRDLMFNHFERYDYQCCTKCDFVFQHPLPTSEKIASFYPSDYDVYEEQSRIKKVSALRKSFLKKYYGYLHLKTLSITDLLSGIAHLFHKNHEIAFVQNGILLDVGCGNGRYLDGMKKLGWQVKGVEFNESAINVCKLSNLDVHHGDIFSANFKDNTFDIINVSHVVEHVPHSKEFFAELTRVLNKNGTLIIKTPNSNALGRALFNTNWFANEVPRHLYLFSEKNLSLLAQTHGLHTQQIKTRSSPKIILNSIDYVSANKSVPSKKLKWKRLIARVYVWAAKHKNQGDEIFAVFTKN